MDMKESILRKLMFAFLVCCLLGNANKCNAKVFYCDSHETPKELQGEFLAFYDQNEDETIYCDSEELDKLSDDFKTELKPALPDLWEESEDVMETASLLNDNINTLENTAVSASTITDNRIKVANINVFPYYSTAKITTTFNSQPGYETCGSGYEVHNRLCATAGHVLLNSDGEYFNTLKVEFGYNNGSAIYTMTQDDLAGYVLHGEFKGTNYRPQIDYAFLYWNRNITNYVGHFGISWSYSAGDTCYSAGYPADKYNGEYMYYSKSTITSISDCEITSNNYNYGGQSGSPLYLQDGYAIGIVSGKYSDNSMVSVQLDNGITTWLYDNGYFGE